MSTDPSRTQIRCDDRPLGPYVIDFKMIPDILNSEEGVVDFSIDVAKLETLILHANNALASLRHRMFIDAVCGPCKVCENTRMAIEEVNGREMSVNCPRCHPRIVAANAAIKRGDPPPRTVVRPASREKKHR